MPQQINLCTPVLQTQRRAFSALAVMQALGLFLVLGAALAGYLAWSLHETSESLRRTMAGNQRERESLLVAIAAHGSRRGPTPEALALELQALRVRLQQREGLLTELRRGRLVDGLGHAERLRLVAQTIPAQVWVTQVVGEDHLLEVQGYALEPADLNDWIARLGAHPLLAGQSLSTVKVERAASDLETLRALALRASAPRAAQAAAPVPGQAASAALASLNARPTGTVPMAAGTDAAPAGQTVWRFTLTSTAKLRLPASVAKPSS